MEAASNNRFVLAGGPGSGKTTLLEALAARGHPCVPDFARAIVRARIEAGQPPRPAPEAFARAIFQAGIEAYDAAPATRPTFFDRGIVDALGMLAECDAMTPPEIETNLRRHPYEARVLLFPPWREIYRTDDERDQTFAESVRVYEATRRWYMRCGYDPVDVPIGTIDERLDFVAGVVKRRAPRARP